MEYTIKKDYIFGKKNKKTTTVLEITLEIISDLGIYYVSVLPDTELLFHITSIHLLDTVKNDTLLNLLGAVCYVSS